MKSKKFLPLALLPMSIALASQAAAQCDVAFDVVNNWGSGAQVNLNIKNTGPAISNWNVCWSFAGAETVADLWNGKANARSGDVCVSDMGWNGGLATSAQAQVGIILSGLNGALPTDFTLNGVSCGATASSASSSVVTSSSESVEISSAAESSVASSIASSVVSSVVSSAVSSAASSAAPAPVYLGPWQLQSDTSAVHAIATHNADGAQILTFDAIEASVATDGAIVVKLPLVNLLAANSDVVSELQAVFGSEYFGHAYFSAQLDWAQLDALAEGDIAEQTLTGQLSLHAVTQNVSVVLSVTKHSQSRITVNTRQPFVINAQDFDLDAGILGMQALAGFDSIGTAVPVYVAFDLVRAQAANADVVVQPLAPVAPANLQADVSAATGDVTLLWNDLAHNETSFVVRRKAADGLWMMHAVVDPNRESLLDNLYDQPGTYDYKIIAVNGAVPSSATDVLRVSYSVPVPVSSAPVFSSSQSSVASSVISSISSEASSELSSSAISSSEMSSSALSSSETGVVISSESSSSEAVSSEAISSEASSVEVSSSSVISSEISSSVQSSSASSSSAPVVTPPDYYSCTNEAPVFGERVVRRLSQKEYANTVRDLFGFTESLSSVLPADVKSGYFPNAVNVVLGFGERAQYAEAANAVVAQVSTRWNELLGCSETALCADAFMADLLPRVLRRPLTVDEEANYLALTQLPNGLSQALRQALSSEAFLYRSEMGEDVGDGVYRLNDYELASFLSYTYLGTTPSAELLADAATGNLRTESGVRAHAEAMLDDPRVHDRLGDVVLQWIDATELEKHDTYALKLEYMQEYGPLIETATALDFSHGMTNGELQFSNLYSPDHLWSNIVLGNMWGISIGWHVTSKYEFSLERSFNRRGGIIGGGAFATRFAKFDPVRNLYEGATVAGRAAAVRERFLCEDMPVSPANKDARIAQMKAADPAFYSNPDLTNRAILDRLTSASDCSSCHEKLLNPLGIGMESINETGSNYYTDRRGNVFSFEGTLHGYGGEAGVPFANSMRGLGGILASHPDVAPTAKSCLATQIMSYSSGIATKQILGHTLDATAAPISNDLRLAQRCDIERMAETLDELTPREMLLQIPTLQSVLYRRSY